MPSRLTLILLTLIGIESVIIIAQIFQHRMCARAAEWRLQRECDRARAWERKCVQVLEEVTGD